MPLRPSTGDGLLSRLPGAAARAVAPLLAPGRRRLAGIPHAEGGDAAMNTPADPSFAVNVQRFSGFASTYDRTGRPRRRSSRRSWHAWRRWRGPGRWLTWAAARACPRGSGRTGPSRSSASSLRRTCAGGAGPHACRQRFLPGGPVARHRPGGRLLRHRHLLAVAALDGAAGDLRRSPANPASRRSVRGDRLRLAADHRSLGGRCGVRGVHEARLRRSNAVATSRTACSAGRRTSISRGCRPAGAFG